jgi:hypothetical protein
VLTCISQSVGNAKIGFYSHLEKYNIPYASDAYRNKKTILRFSVNTYLQGFFCIKRWGYKCMSLYLHAKWIEMPRVFKSYGFRSQLCELDEKSFASDKRILKYFTNRNITCEEIDVELDVRSQLHHTNAVIEQEPEWWDYFKTYCISDYIQGIDYIQSEKEVIFFTRQKVMKTIYIH